MNKKQRNRRNRIAISPRALVMMILELLCARWSSWFVPACNLLHTLYYGRYDVIIKAAKNRNGQVF